MFRSLILFMVLAMVLPPPQMVFAQRDGSDEKTMEEATPQRAEPDYMPHALEGPIDPSTYILGPGDELVLILRGPSSTVHRALVLPEGVIILPNIGSYPAAGMSLAEFKKDVTRALGRYYRNVDIDVQLAKPRVFTAFVLGEVINPGPVVVVAPFRVSHVVRGAGGVKPNGSQRLIEIREDGKTVRTVDLFAFFQLGDFEHNPTLKEGQSIFVPAKRTVVSVIGEVRLSGTYEIVPGETVEDLLRFCGGINSRGDDGQILLERTLTGEHFKLTMEEASDFEPRDLDIVVVRDFLSFEKNDPVEVVGGGGRTGAIQIERGEPLGDFLSRLWRFQPGFETETGILERKQEDGSITYIEFDVREVLAGDSIATTYVEPGDIVSFHLRDQQVFVVGEVALPSGVPFLPGYPAERYIALAGGPSEAGSVDRLNIYNLDGTKRSGDRSSTIYRGETIEVRRKKSKLLGTAWVGITSLTGLILAIYAVSN